MREVAGSLYEAAATAEQWQEAMDGVHRLFDSAAAHFFQWDETADRPLASFGSSTYTGQQLALNRYLRIDPRRILLARQPVGWTLLCHEHFDDAFVARDEFFQDYSLPQGRRYLMATKLYQAGPEATILAVLRSSRQGPFGAQEHALLDQLRPHLQRAVRLHQRRTRERELRQVERDLLDAAPVALIATDAGSRIVRMNRAAEALLSGGDGLSTVAGRVTACHPAQTEALRQLIARTLSTPNGEGAMIVEGAGGGRHAVTVTRLKDRPADQPLALVVVNSLDPSAAPSGHLVRLFGLTPAEARLAAGLATGHRLDELALAFGVRMPTLRTQLRAVYDKTGTTRQAELVRLIGRLPAPLAGACPLRRRTHQAERGCG